MEEAFCGNQWINKGSDCGYYIIYFGTVASARKALMSGVSSIEISLNWDKDESSDSDFKEAVVSAMSKLLHSNLLQALSSFVDKDRSSDVW